MRVAVVVGNPKPASRTLDAATRIATRLRDRPPDTIVDLAELGSGVLDPEDPAANRAVADVCDAATLVIASPTYKATFTGLLKVFLDRFPSRALDGKTAFPLMLGGAWHHALAPEVFLKPVLAELGASCPMPALFLLDSDYEDPGGLAEWIEAARRHIV